MKFSVLSDKLYNTLEMLKLIVPSEKRAALPVLTWVSVQPKDGRMVLEVTNISETLKVYLGAKIDVEGQILLPFEKLMKVIATAPHDAKTGVRVDFTYEPKTANCELYWLDGDSNRVTLKNTLPFGEFPAIPTQPKETPLQHTEGSQWYEGLNTTIPYSASDDSRPILCGVNVECQIVEGRLQIIFVAADGYRLGIVEYPVEFDNQFAENTNFNIPRQAALNLVKLLKLQSEKYKGDIDYGAVLFAVEDGRLYVQGRTWEYSVTLNEGRFPDYRMIVPTEPATIVTAYTQELRSTCKKASIFAADEAHHIQLAIEKINNDNKGLVALKTSAGFFASNPHIELVTDASVENIQHEELLFAMNYSYYGDALKVDSELYQLHYTGSNAPMVIVPVSNPYMKFIVMPMSVGR